MLKRMLLTKVAFWMIVIGAAVLLLPQPLWPRWSGWLLLVSGVILGPVALLGGRRSRPSGASNPPPPETR